MYTSLIIISHYDNSELLMKLISVLQQVLTMNVHRPNRKFWDRRSRFSFFFQIFRIDLETLEN